MTRSPVKQALQEQGRSINWLARQMDIERSILSKKLDGKLLMSRDEVRLAAAYLQVPAEQLLGEGVIRIRVPREAVPA